jgi:hypothetical protein
MPKQNGGVITMHPGRRSYALAVGLLLLTFGQYVWAGSPKPGAEEIPKVILSGLEAYKAEGPEAAVKAWIKGSSIEGSKEALSQANVLRQVQDFYGTYKAFELIRSRDLTPTTRIIYLTLNYEKGPLFAKFTAYRAEQGWIIANFTFNTKEDLILPTCP